TCAASGHFLENRAGNFSIMIALLGTPLLVAVGLSVDWSWGKLTRRISPRVERRCDATSAAPATHLFYERGNRRFGDTLKPLLSERRTTWQPKTPTSTSRAILSPATW